MASDQVTITLGVLAAVLPVAATLMATRLNQRFQARSEREAFKRDIERERLRQEYALRRDRQAKYYEFNVQLYREHREACIALLSAAASMPTVTVSKYEAEQALRKPQSPETIARDGAEAKVHESTLEAASIKAQQALEVLRVDPASAQVVKLYRSLPLPQLIDAPLERDARQRWKEAFDKLQEAVVGYLQELHGRYLEGDIGGILQTNPNAGQGKVKALLIDERASSEPAE